MYAEVLIEYPSKKIDKTFTYIIPNNLQNKIKLGMHVKIPFNNKIINGFVLNILDDFQSDYSLKEIISIIDEELVFNEELLNLANFLHDNTLAPLISCFQAMLPSSLKIKNKKGNYQKYETYLKLKNKDLINNLTGKNQKELVADLLKNEYVLKNSYSNSTVKSLIDKDIIEEVKEIKYRINKTTNEEKSIHKLNENQLQVFNNIIENKNKYDTFLLEGVTGSGKTEVYLHLINEVLKDNKTAIILVPEITLTAQIVNRFYDWFGSNVAIFHSSLSDGEKYDEYMKIIRGEVSIVVGTRSSIFLPLKNIGMIIIDECHSDTYKQDNTPRYNALEVAEIRTKYHNCPLILGSATPQLEVRARALKGVYKYLKLDKRVNDKELPEIKLIDMTDEIKKGNFIFSKELQEKIQEKIAAKEQVILFLNRRGFSTTVSCSSCGYTYKCKNCDITLTYHKTSNNLRCHYCGYTIAKSEECPNCHENGLNFLGLGTEKVEAEIQKLFPTARTIRMDQDSTSKKGSHEEIVTSFKNGDYDILLGTQMVSKGLDFPKVTLVGVINADNSLNIPDFRSNEKTFELLTQVSGRAGRSELPGEIILQTYNPDNEILNFVKNYDFDGFYNYEMNLRRLLKYPPYYYLVGIKVTSKSYEEALKEANNVVTFLKRNIDKTSIILGPTTHNIFKFNNVYRFQIIIKYRFDDYLFKDLQEIDKEYLFNNNVNIEIDINPRNI